VLSKSLTVFLDAALLIAAFSLAILSWEFFVVFAFTKLTAFLANVIFFFLSFNTFYYFKIYCSLYIILSTSFLTSTCDEDYNIFFSRAFYFYICYFTISFYAFSDFLNYKICASTFFRTFLKAGESYFFFGKNDF